MALSDEILADTPIAYWPVDDASGSTVVDASGNSRNATWDVGPAAYNQASILAASSGSADLERGSEHCARVADASWQSGMSGLTLEAVYQPESQVNDSTNVFHTMISKALNASGYCFYMDYSWRSGGPKLAFGVTSDGSFGTNGYEGHWQARIEPGIGAHFVVTWDGSSTDAGFRAYLDGKPLLTYSRQAGAGTLTTVHNGTAALMIGAWASDFPADWADGRMSDVAIYDYALSQDRVLAHARAATNQTLQEAIGLGDVPLRSSWFSA